MLNKIVSIFFLLLFVTGIAFAETTLYSGDDKIDEIQKRIDEEKERQEKEKDKGKGTDYKDDSNCFGDLLSACLEGLIHEICSGNSDSDRQDTDQGSRGCNISGLFEIFNYAPFPYAGDWGNDIVRCKNTGNANRKWGFLTASAAGSYLFENTKSLTTLLEANFFFIHLNGFYQYTMAETETMNIFSINGGISLPLPFMLFNAYCGVFYYDYIGSPLFSFGGSAKIFLPFNFYLDIYNLNSFFGSLGFHIITASLNYALDRFSIGGGYRFHSYAGVILQGPEIILSVWF